MYVKVNYAYYYGVHDGALVYLKAECIMTTITNLPKPFIVNNMLHYAVGFSIVLQYT